MSSVVEVATQGEPERVLAAVLERLRVGSRGVYAVTIQHDPGCPCVTGKQPLAACSCELVRVSRRRVR